MFEDLRCPPARFSACDRRAHARLDVPHTPAAKRRVFRLELEPCLHEESRRPRLGKTERRVEKKHALRVAGEEPTRFVVWRPDTRRPGGQPRPAVADVELGPEDQRIDDGRGVRFVVIFKVVSARRSEARTGNLDDGVAAASPREPRAVVSVAGQVDARGDGGARDDRVRDVVEVRGRRRDEGSVVRRRNVSFAERFVLRSSFSVRGGRGERAREPFAQRNRRRRRRVFVFVRVVEDSCESSGRGSFERSRSLSSGSNRALRPGQETAATAMTASRGTEKWLTYSNPARRAHSLRLSISASAPSPQRSAKKPRRAFATSARNETNEKGSHRNTQAGVFPSALSAAPRRVAACCPAAACALRRASCARVRSASAASSASANASASASHTAAARATRGSASTSSKSTPPRPSRSSSAVTRASLRSRRAGVERDATRSQYAAKRKSSSGRGSYPASNATSTRKSSPSSAVAFVRGIREPHVRHRRQHGGAVRVARRGELRANRFQLRARLSVRRRGVGGGDVGVRARLRETRVERLRAGTDANGHRRVCVYALYASLFRTGDNWCRFFRLFNKERLAFARCSPARAKGALRGRRKKNTLRRRRRGRAPPP